MLIPETIIPIQLLIAVIDLKAVALRNRLKNKDFQAV